jgi:hypothetical protein
MGQFSVKISGPTGSILSGIQQVQLQVITPGRQGGSCRRDTIQYANVLEQPAVTE